MKQKTFLLSTILFSTLAAALILPQPLYAQNLRFNVMPSDYELLRLKNETQGTANWTDPISANAGDYIRFSAYYHCWTDNSDQSAGDRAQNTKIRISFPAGNQAAIPLTGQALSSNTISATDNATINVSSAQQLIFDSTATWYRDNNANVSNVSVIQGTGYVEVNLGDIGCDYSNCYTNSGFVNFRAKLTSPSAPIIINTPSTLSISKIARNLSDGAAWQEIAQADPNEIISFWIEIKNTSNTSTAKNVMIKDSLPERIRYYGDFKIDGVPTANIDINTGFSLGDLAPGQTKIIVFNSEVGPSTQFSFGTTELINTALAYNTDASVTDIAKVAVTRKAVAGATTVSTGFTNNRLVDYLLLPLIFAMIVTFVFKKYLILLSAGLEKTSQGMFDWKAEKILAMKIRQIKAREK